MERAPSGPCTLTVATCLKMDVFSVDKSDLRMTRRRQFEWPTAPVKVRISNIQSLLPQEAVMARRVRWAPSPATITTIFCQTTISHLGGSISKHHPQALQDTTRLTITVTTGLQQRLQVPCQVITMTAPRPVIIIIIVGTVASSLTTVWGTQANITLIIMEVAVSTTAVVTMARVTTWMDWWHCPEVTT